MQSITFDTKTIAAIFTSLSQQKLLNRSAIRAHYNCGRNFTTTHYFLSHMLLEPTYCQYCNAELFFRETNGNCCSSGKIIIHYPTPPQELLTLFTDDGEVGSHFRTNIRFYNDAFAFTSMVANVDQNLAYLTK